MRSRRNGLLWVTPLLLMVFGQAWGLDQKADFHQITGQRPIAACQECHVQMPGVYLKSSSLGSIPDWNAYKLDGTELCVQCHEESKKERLMGGAAVDFAVPSDLPLTAENTLMCMSCHYMHGSQQSDRPWASVSVMDRMTGNERMRKTYLLRRNNSDGELCLVCHNPNEENPK
jgi:hypothetical protein